MVVDSRLDSKQFCAPLDPVWATHGALCVLLRIYRGGKAALIAFGQVFVHAGIGLGAAVKVLAASSLGPNR